MSSGTVSATDPSLPTPAETHSQQPSPPAAQNAPKTTPKRARFADDIPSPPSQASSFTSRPKRIKEAPTTSSKQVSKVGVTRAHPLNIRPLGNAYLADRNIKSSAGLLGQLPDEVVMMVMEALEKDELVQMGKTCKFLYAFSRADEIWRGLYIRSLASSAPSTESPKFSWRGTWRRSILGYNASVEAQIDCKDLYSDVLHRPFQCANLCPLQFASNIPAGNQIARVSNLTHEEYATKWAAEPFILTDPAKSWPAARDWTVGRLVDQFGDTKFQAEAVEWTLKTYVEYMLDNQDESPLYLFDHAFAEKMGVNGGAPGDPGSDNLDAVPDWTAPPCFGPDFFSVLGPDRPHHRWLILGPARSGSTFHKDPNGTSAWNAVLTGSKYWLMFPSSSSTRTHAPPPPGVFVSADGSEVTAPLSLAEYLLTFHAEARRAPGAREGICRAGEIVHVPAGWFHMVVNLDDSVAITQNFVPRRNLPDVLAFLRDQPDEVSGFDCDKVPDPYARFVDRLREKCPDELEWAETTLRKRDEAASRWERAIKPDSSDGDGSGGGSGGGFSFGFSF